MNLIKLFLILILISATNLIYSQTSVAVIDLRSVGLEEQFSVLLTDALRSELFKYEKFEVMNRENMQEIMGEQAFQASGVCDDNACYVEMGNVLGVEKIVTGSIGKLGKTYSLTIKMIDVNTSKNDYSNSEFKKCSEDDLFIMIQNEVKRLVGLKKEKITTPEALTEIKEIKEIPRSNPSDGYTVQNNEIKEWEMLGLSRNEFLEFKKCGLSIDEWKNYNDEIESPKSNAILSFFIPGLGQLSINENWIISPSIEIVTWFAWSYGVFYADNSSVLFMSSAVIIGTTNRIFSSYYAYNDTKSYNENLKQKYKLSLSPTYIPQNNGIGIGFTVNF